MREFPSHERMILSENRFPPRIKCGASFFGIMLCPAIYMHSITLEAQSAAMRTRVTVLARAMVLRGLLCPLANNEGSGAPTGARVQRHPSAGE